MIANYKFEEFRFPHEIIAEEIEKQEVEDELAPHPVIQFLDDVRVGVLQDKNLIYCPAEVRNFEEETEPRFPQSYFLQTDIYDMFTGIPISSRRRKNSTQSTDSMVLEY